MFVLFSNKTPSPLQHSWVCCFCLGKASTFIKNPSNSSSKSEGKETNIMKFRKFKIFNNFQIRWWCRMSKTYFFGYLLMVPILLGFFWKYTLISSLRFDHTILIRVKFFNWNFLLIVFLTERIQQHKILIPKVVVVILNSLSLHLYQQVILFFLTFVQSFWTTFWKDWFLVPS